jgi:hypothetical protein
MGRRILRTLTLAAAALLFVGCAFGDAGQRRRERLVRDLADDAAAFNEAYAQAMTGQLLLNVLRARDRLPTQYLAMSSIQDAPTVTSSQSFTLGSLTLGDITSPWGVGEASIGREVERHPSYSLGPFASEDLRRVVFDPTEPAVFAEYWNAGWPKDILLLLMADRVIRVEHAGARGVAEFVNDAERLIDNCEGEFQEGGCAYVQLSRTLARELRGRAPDRAMDKSGVCGLAAAYSPTRPQPRRPDTPACDRAARVLIGEVEYVIFLRSLDDIIYYLGELLRDDGALQGAFEAPIRIGSAGIEGGGRGVPLFRVVSGEARGRFAASVIYNGVRYSAGPAVSRACALAAESGPCRDDAENGDRSSQVLALLMQLLLRHQSDQSVPAPPTVVITQ